MNGKLLAGAVIAVLLVVVAVSAPWVARHDPNRQDLGAIRAEPVWSARTTAAGPA